MHNFFSNFHVEWGPRGHQLVAQTAQQLLTPKAATQVKAILKPLENASLGSIANWADIIKGSVPKDQDSKDFVKKFPDRGKNWHFVDLPLEARSYDRSIYPKFTRDDDVVQMINLSISVLQGKNTSMSSLNALRWLTHLAGDIHQPLHVSCGYIDPSGKVPKLVGDPQYIEKNNLSSDRGGNGIILSPAGAKELNLHSYWDGMLGFSDTEDMEDQPLTGHQVQFVHTMAEEIKSDYAASSPKAAGTPKPVLQWAADWAKDSLIKAREAYKSIEITEKIKDGKYRVKWEGKESYEHRCIPIVEQQLKLASERLADVLNTLYI